MPPFRDDQILIIAPGSQTTLAQLGLPESYTPARFRLRSRMFNAEKEGEFEPVKIRRRDENAPAQQNGNGANGEAEENDGWEEDHISEEGAVWPMKQGRIVDWPAFYALMTHVFNTVNPPFHTPVLLISEPVWTPKDLEKVTQFFFERFKVPAFAVMDAAMAAAYAYGVPTATVVDVGLEKANITCVSDFVLQHIGRSLAVSDCGGEALTDRLVEVMKGRKGFGRDVCDQLKRSGICEILPSDAEILKPGAGTEDASANPAAAASTGIDGSNKPAGSGAAGDVPRGPGPGTEVGEQKLEDEDGVLDIASIVTGGNMQEYLAQKEREKAEKAAAKQKKGTEAQSTTAPKPVRQQPNSKRLRNTFMYEDINLHNAMKKAGMSGQNMSDMHSALGEGPNKRQKTPEPGSAVSEAPADGGLEAAQENSSGSIFRREIEVGPERFQAASGGILDRLADAVYRTVQSCNDINRRSDLWDNMIILGNGSKVRGFKDALLARLSEKYIISPSSATIFTSELPSNLSTPIATGANTPMPQMPGQPHPSSSVNPLLVAATTAQNPHFNPAQSAFGHQSSHSHSGHGQTPTSIKFVKFPEYFPEWKEVGYDEAAFLGAQVAAKVLYVTDSANNGYMSRTTYNDQGPSGIHEVAFNHVPTHHGRQKACCAKLDGAKKKPQPSSPATDQVSSDLVTQATRLDTLHRAVLDTTEFLECILSHLPMKQIFGVQRVSRLWKDAVARSPIIQEKLFLKLKSKPTELWALLEHARRAQFKGRELRLEKLTSESDVESVSATDATMFAPVALNPFLQLGHDPDEGPMCDKPVYDRARYHTPETTEFCEGLAFGLGSSLMDTHISDPPCMRARIGKPLTLGDVIAQTWTDDKWINKMTSTKIHDDSGWSNQDERVNMVPEHEYDENDEILELDLLAGIIEQLEIKHECKVVFKPEHTVIYLADDSETDTGPFPLVPTESERRDVIDHDKDAYAALMLAIDADKKEWEAESKKSRQPMSQELLKTLFLQLQQAREG